MIQRTKVEMEYDNGGRRLGGDRRQYSYAAHLPERRSGKDRRSGVDRRDLADFKPRKDGERRAVFLAA